MREEYGMCYSEENSVGKTFVFIQQLLSNYINILVDYFVRK